MDNFDFNLDGNDIPIINLTATGLSFNEACVLALDSPEYIGIGLDRKNKKLAVKAILDENSGLRRYRFAINEKKNRAAVTASNLRFEVIKLNDKIPYRRVVKYLAEFDRADGMLIVDLTKNIER